MQQTVTQQELISLLNSHLYQLGWTWQHPRIKAYLDRVSNRLLMFQFQSVEQIPVDYLARLVRLVEIYYHCDRLLKMMKKGWKDKDIMRIVISYGYGDEMPIKGYEQLKGYLDDLWYNQYGF